MLNGSPINGAPLNGGGAGFAQVQAVRGQAYTWRLRLLIGGVDMSAQLTGSVDVDREEGAAGISGFDLHIPAGQPVVPTEWIGRNVTLDYISRARSGTVTESRVYTGRLELPAWDPVNRLLSCECSDQLQQRVEAMNVAAIDALVGGNWSADLFDAIEGRSRWDYALERLESRPASLDSSPTGDLRVTSWFAAPAAHYVFGPGTVLDGSVQVELPQLRSLTNRIEIEFGYRYSRLWQHNRDWTWIHPDAVSGGFCNWRTWSTELPTTEMIEDALSGAGMQQVGVITGSKLPPSAGDPCGDGTPWINNFGNLWLAFGVTGARRWVQTVTERYTISITAPGGEDPATQIIARDSASIEIEDDRADAWADGEPGATSSADVLADEARRQAALICLLNGAQTSLLAAHRGTTLSWQTPTDLALGVDLIHTLELDDSAKARGKCRRIVHAFDLEAGTAITTLSVAIMRGGGVGTPLAVPAAPSIALPALPSDPIALPTQLGGRLYNPRTGNPVPAYDDELAGFSGNWDVGDDLTAESIPRRLDIDSIEIPAEYNDEMVAEAAPTFTVAIPDDLLEL